MDRFTRIIRAVPRYWKAVVGAVTPGVVALVASVQDASPGGDDITKAEWVAILAACVLTGGAVAGTPNAKK